MKGMRPLTDQEVSAVSAQLGARDRAFFILGVRTGFRVSELLSLRIADVENAGEVARSVNVARKSMKGKGEGRTVPLNESARAALAPWLAELFRRGAKVDSALFQSKKGGAIGRVQAWTILTEAYHRAGVSGRLGTHSMRKTFAAKMYARLDRDLIETQKALGHKSVTSTASYLSFAESKVNDAIMRED